VSISSNNGADSVSPVQETDVIPDSAALLFAPLDKRAFGTAIGVAFGLVIAAVTIATLLSPQPIHLGLLSHYFAGFTVSWAGVIVGALWGFCVGFVAGWLMAFTRNLSLAVSLFLLRSKAELNETSDFLDHI
jgi:hypothetical protein